MNDQYRFEIEVLCSIIFNILCTYRNKIDAYNKYVNLLKN